MTSGFDPNQPIGQGNDPYGQGQWNQPQPGYGQPQYGAPGYGQPQYGAPGYGAPGYGAGPAPDNNLVWGILCAVLCCLPAGIVAIVKSTSVEKLWAAGDFQGAQKAADDAKNWAMWGAIASAALYIIGIIIYVIFIVAIIGSASTY